MQGTDRQVLERVERKIDVLDEKVTLLLLCERHRLRLWTSQKPEDDEAADLLHEVEAVVG